MTLRRRACLLLLLLPLFASGCMMWGAHRLPEAGSGQRLPDPVRLTLANGATLVLHDPILSADSVVGYVDGRERSAVALAEVRQAQARKTNFVGTAGVAFIATLTAAAVVTVLVLSAVWGGGDI